MSSDKKALHKEIMQRVDMQAKSTWIATCLGVGFMYPGPGTWGTLLGLFGGVILFAWFGKIALAAGLIIICILAIPAIREYTQQAEKEDAGSIVIDEVAGIWLTLLFAQPAVGSWILAFLLFRFFDILKPFPICWFDENMKGPWGVMADDLVAGLMAGLVLLLVSNVFFI